MAQNCLRKQQDIHPLIVVVIHTILGGKGATAKHSMRRLITADNMHGAQLRKRAAVRCTRQQQIHRKRAVYPTPIVVEGLIGAAVHAIHRFAKELNGGHHCRRYEQHDKRELGVQFEDIIVDIHVFGAQKTAKRSQNAQHRGHDCVPRMCVRKI